MYRNDSGEIQKKAGYKGVVIFRRRAVRLTNERPAAGKNKSVTVFRSRFSSASAKGGLAGGRVCVITKYPV